MQGSFRVECRNGDERADFPGLPADRAVERVEAERGKGRWARVAMHDEDTGKLVVAYNGGGRVKGE